MTNDLTTPNVSNRPDTDALKPSDTLSDAELESLDDIPEIVEIRMDYTKDVVQLARGSGCSWK